MFLSRPLFFLALYALLAELIFSPELPGSLRFLCLFFLVFLSLFLFQKKKGKLLFCAFLSLLLFSFRFYSLNRAYEKERQSIDYILPLKAVLRGKLLYIEEQEQKWKLHLSSCIVDTDLGRKKSPSHNKKYRKRNALPFQKLILYLPKDSSEISPLPGQIYTFKGQFLELHPATNEGEFSLPSYYKGEGVSGIFQATALVRVEGEAAPFSEELFSLKHILRKQIERLFPDELAGFLKGLFLGERSGISLNEKSLYQSAGISHILAISGLHLSLLGEFFYFLLRKMRLSSLLSSLLSSFFLFSYFLFTGSSHSAFRALLMLFLRFSAIQLGKGKDLLSQLSFALLLLLWLNPLSIYSIGMQCSFFTLFVFFLLQERPGKMVRKKKEKDLAKVLKKKKIVLQKLPSLLSKLISGIFAILPTRIESSFLFYLALLPLFSLTQFSFPLYAPLLNLILLPLLPLFFLLGALSLFLSFLPCQNFLPIRFFSFSSQSLLKQLYHFFHIMMEKSLRLPFSQIPLGKMQAASIGSYLLILYLLFFLPWPKVLYLILQKRILSESKHSFRSYNTILSVSLSLGFLLSIPLYLPKPPKELEITALDVGQGDGFILRKENLVLTIDNGSTTKNLFPEQIFFPYCKAKRIQHIDYALLTHCDRDHISGIQALLEKNPSIKLYHLILPSSAEEDHRYDLLKRLAYNHGAEILYWQNGSGLSFSKNGEEHSLSKNREEHSLSENKEEPFLPEKGEGLSLSENVEGGQLHIRCFYPNDAGYMEEANAHSIGCLLEYGQFRMLFTGDMPKEAEVSLLKNCYEAEVSPAVDILKLAHHGSKTSSCPDFLLESQAKFALFSYGKRNRYGHPHKNTLENCREYRLFPLETAKLGEILIKTNGEQYEITAPLG